MSSSDELFRPVEEVCGNVQCSPQIMLPDDDDNIKIIIIITAVQPFGGEKSTT